jgi:hypothetical protein
MSQQMNFQGGVNKKSTTSTASCGEAEKGESKGSPQQFPCDVPPPKARTPKSGPQKNFPNGS